MEICGNIYCTQFKGESQNNCTHYRDSEPVLHTICGDYSPLNIDKLFPALSNMESRVLYWHKVKRKTHEETSKLLNIKRRTSENTYYRATNRLKRIETSIDNANILRVLKQSGAKKAKLTLRSPKELKRR